MKKILFLSLFITACSSEPCPEYDIKPTGLVNGVETYVLRTEVLPSDQPLSARDNAIITQSKTCPRGYQDINIQYEPSVNVGPNYKNISFYCL